MTWPIYISQPWEGFKLPPEIIAHNAAQLGASRLGPPARHGCAVDVWHLTPAYPLGPCRHLWRSYNPATGESLQDWTLRAQPDLLTAPASFDASPWAVPPLPPNLPPGATIPRVEGIDAWPVPTAASLTGPMSLREIRQALFTLLALAQWPEAPGGFDRIPTVPAMTQRVARGNGSAILAIIAEGIALRAYIAPMVAASPAASAPPLRYSVTVQRRQVRAGALDATLPEGTYTFEAPADASPPVISRLAKTAAGVLGWPTQVRPDLGPGLYLFQRAPYQMTVSRED